MFQFHRQELKHSPHDIKDIPINEFTNFHREMIENSKEKIKEEYTAIQSFSESLEKTCVASKANEKLNRYTNINCFDENRVVLNDDEFENDYINASYINGYHYPQEYIATQGPKPNTGHDFWRMVLQHKVESIVMLTSLIEDNKVKCHEYFPKLNGQITSNNICITCTSEQAHPTYIKRIMEVEKVSENKRWI
jgi:protein tyrosine phosphatase